MRRTVLLLVLFGLLATGTACAHDGPTRTVPEFLADYAGHARDDVSVGGVFVGAPVTSGSGTMFSIAETPDSDEKVDVYLHETTPLAAQWGGRVLEGDDLIGHLVIVTGDYKSQVLVAEDVVIQEGGGYRAP